MIEARLRHKIHPDELEQKKGKILTNSDANILLTGPCTLRKPNGSLLAVYLPGVIGRHVDLSVVYAVLHPLKTMVTDNRGLASGSERYRHGDEKRTRSKKVASCIIGSFDPGGPKQFCRLTAWTGKETERFALLYPLFRSVNAYFKEYVPERYAKQLVKAVQTDPAWRIPETVFTTVTVNNTYPTGVHTDSGDLVDGFSTLVTLRRGSYTGGVLMFPEYRVGVDMQDGDLLLMDAHEWHGNTAIVKQDDEAERISIVSYFRTGMVGCGTADDEYRKAVTYAEKRGGNGRVDDDGAGEG